MKRFTISRFFAACLAHCTILSKHIPDEPYLKIMYRGYIGKRLNLENPTTFNEKIQWLKIHDRKPEYSKMVDKYEAKKFVSDIIGEEYIIPTLGVWDHYDQIDFDTLPEQFVLKCTHDSGGLVICKDKSKLDHKAAKRKLEASLKKNYFWRDREWPYKNVKPRIIAEQYMVDESGYELKDYKFLCFDGFAKAMFIAQDRQVPGELTKFDFYDMNFEHLPIIWGHPNSEKTIVRPQKFNEMRKIAEKLSAGIPHVRVDFYEINGQVYFGEMTFYHDGGMVPIKPDEWDNKLGELIEVPISSGGGYLVANVGYMIWLHSNKFTTELVDYKFYCFNGEPCFLYVSSGLSNHKTARMSFLTLDWKFADFHRIDYLEFETLPPKPSHFNEMIDIAKELSCNHSFIRVDLYEINHKVYFSELTFSPNGGLMPIAPNEYDEIIGNLIDLKI